PCCALVALAAILAGTIRPAKNASIACVLATMIFAGYLLARNRVSPVDYLARPDFFIVLGALTIYLLVAYYITGSRERMVVATALLILGLGQVVVGAIQFKRGDAW